MPIIKLYIIEEQHQSAKPSWREQNKANKRATKEDDMKRKKKRTLLAGTSNLRRRLISCHATEREARKQ
jgi:hypothetical protein